MFVRKTAIIATVAALSAGGAFAQTVTATTGSDVTIMKDPGSDATVISSVPASTSLTVQGCTPDGTWCQVSDSNGQSGWVKADTVNVQADGQTYALSNAPSTVTIKTIKGNKEQGAATGMLGGAAAGAIAGGPVGAAIGAAVGAAGGAALGTPDKKVITYTQSNPVPSVAYSGTLAVGSTLPDTITLTPVPDSDYAYAYLDNTPVVVNPSSRKVITIVK